jgi:hypothetical protein
MGTQTGSGCDFAAFHRSATEPIDGFLGGDWSRQHLCRGEAGAGDLLVRIEGGGALAWRDRARGSYAFPATWNLSDTAPGLEALARLRPGHGRRATSRDVWSA